MAVSVSRKIAYEVLRRVEAEGAYASDELHDALGERITPNDAALATAIAMGVLRWRRLLDFLLDRHLKKPVERLDLAVAIALRTGLYQLRFLDKIPARAAVNESVELVKQAGKTSAATLVNAVLRRCAEESALLIEESVSAVLPAAERIGIAQSHPTWIVDRWLAKLGVERTTALLEANNRTPRLTCAIHDPSEKESIVHGLENAGLRVEPGALLKDAVEVSGGSVTRTNAFRAGKISVQDEASQAITPLLGVKKGNRVLDVCAAPGGKAAMIMRAAGGQGLVVAADLHAHRVRAMREQFERLGYRAANVLDLDATQPLPLGATFDRVLVDAPCSGTGTLARHPEIRWRLRLEQLAEFRKLQTSILRNAAEALAPGGRLVYSTCSLEPEENENVADDFLRRNGTIRRVPAKELARDLETHLKAGVDAGSLFDRDGYFQTSPAVHRTDGFFAAVFVKPLQIRPKKAVF